MNKYKLQAKMIELGVIDDSDIVIINCNESFSSAKIIVVTVDGEVSVYYYHSNNLTYVEGICYVRNVEIMKKLNLEEFE